MTDQEIRIAVAECCGWKFNKISSGWWTCTNPQGHESFQYATLGELLSKYIVVPNYLADLNAMHEAEEHALSKLTWDKGWDLFDTHLLHIAAEAHEHTSVTVIYMLRATARQRAEAFLRTLGKWKD